jgi:hypothetical protein
MHIFLAHVDDAVQAEKGTDGSGSYTVLPGTGLGDDSMLAHPPGKKALPQRIVDFMGAGVGQVLAFKENTRASAMAA